MQTVQFIGAALALFVSSVAFAQDTPQQTASLTATGEMTAETYVAIAASSDLFEIASSELVLRSVKSAVVKSFAEHMVSDHSATTQGILSTADAGKIKIPGGMIPEHAEMLRRLVAATPRTLEAQYVEVQVMLHEEAVALHTGYSQNGDDAALKAVATKAVPIVTEHLKDAQALASKA